MIRSKLFVPGSRPELFEKALASAADALSFDLEDAVAEDRKAAARSAVASFLRTRTITDSDKVVVVRVNQIQSPFFQEDIRAVVGPGLDIINVPKLESAEQVVAAAEAISQAESASGYDSATGILANIETPKGLRFAADIACAHKRVIGLQIGLIDLCSRTGIEIANREALQSMRLQVRLAAAEAGIACYDSAFPDIRNTDGFRESALDARQLGFLGKSCIHPSQIPIANDVFSPRPDEIAYARKVIAKAETSSGVFTVDGKMVDAPIIAQARAVLAAAAISGSGEPHMDGAET